MKQPLFITSDVGVDISFYRHNDGIELWFNPNLNNTFKKVLSGSDLIPLSNQFLESTESKTNIVFNNRWFSKIWVTIKPIDNGYCKGSFCLGFGPWVPMTIYWFKIKKENLLAVSEFLNKTA